MFCYSLHQVRRSKGRVRYQADLSFPQVERARDVDVDLNAPQRQGKLSAAQRISC